MRRYAAILPTLTLLFLTASAFAASGKIKLGMGVGSLNDRVFRLENFTVPIGYYETSTQLDSANIRNQLPRGTTWLHRRLNQNYVFFKMHNDDIVGGQPDNWNTAYDWVSSSYGAFVTGATNSTLTRSGSGTMASPYTLGLNLGNANTFTADQTAPKLVADTVVIEATGDVGKLYLRYPASANSNTTFTFPEGHGTLRQVLKSNGSTGTPFWEAETDGVIGNEVTDTNGSTLTRSGSGTSGAPYKLQVNLANANTWTATQTDTAGFVTKYATDDAAISTATLNGLFGTRAAGWMGTYYDSNLDKMYWITWNGATWWWVDMTKAP